MNAGGGRETILADRLITPTREIESAFVRVAGGRIESVGLRRDLPEGETTPHVGHLLIPGMIDLHVNGAGGVDLAQDDPDAVSRVGRILARHGCTGYLATLITDRQDRLTRTLESLGRRIGQTTLGARALGIHLEGPFINPGRKGAHPPEGVQRPSREAFDAYRRAAGGGLRMLTLAPELPGALELISEARRDIPIVALGHSEADLECGLEAIQRGANAAVHVFNAMPPLHHREPGLVAAILNSSGIVAEIIADGVHVHPEMVRILYRCKGASRIALVTDAVSAAGMPDGRYRVGPVEIWKSDGVCRDGDGALAGSALQMDEGLRNLRRWLDGEPAVPLRDLVGGASLLPATLLGLANKGRTEAGCDADLVLLDEDLRVLKTWVEGRLVYDRAAG